MKKRGGARPGAGRKKIEGMIKTTLSISNQTNDLLIDYSKCVGMTKNNLADKLLFMSLHPDNKDFLFCPYCRMPVIYIAEFTSLHPENVKVPFTCSSCKKTFEVDSDSI